MSKKIDIKKEMKRIVQEYLHMVSKTHQEGVFSKYSETKLEKIYYGSFNVISPKIDNKRIVQEELLFEGLIRSFLVNPIMKMLLDKHGYKNDWVENGLPIFYTMSNREYEYSFLVEFIVEINGKKIGYKYTDSGIRGILGMRIRKSFRNALSGKEKLPGFKKIKTVDKVISISWSGITDDEIQEMHRYFYDKYGYKWDKDISLKAFFLRYFSEEEYDAFIECSKEAIGVARRIVALKVVPQLTTNNILQFKENKVLFDLNETVKSRKYEFDNDEINESVAINEIDIRIMNSKIEKQKLLQSIIGKADFAQSFITAEYLYETIDSQLGIDYSPIVLGYVKSVEQLMYVIYDSFFRGEDRKEYWDKCNHLESFDIGKAQYREIEYRNTRENTMEIQWQELYSHKKNEPGIMNMGKLTLFLRSNSEVWELSDESMNYIVDCLDDYRIYSRNGYLHKDMIKHSDFNQIKRIRNNTIICLYYLLGAFKLLNDDISVKKQLMIIDSSFEKIYKEIYLDGRDSFFYIKIKDVYEGYVAVVQDDLVLEYDEWGLIKNAEIKLAKMNEKDIRRVYGQFEIVNTDNKSIIKVTRDTQLEIIEKKDIERKND